MMIYTILFLCIIRTDRLFLLSPDNAPEISSEAITSMRPKYFFERFEAVQSVQIILRGRFVSHKVSNSFF